MAIDFPSNPINGQSYAGYIYDSAITAWRNANTETGVAALNTMGLKNVVPTSVTVNTGSASYNANGKITFSGVTFLYVNGVFSSSYDKYRILIRCTGTALGAATYFRLRSGVTERSGANYYYGGYMCREGGTLSSWSGNTNTVFDVNRLWTGAQGTTSVLEVFNPYDANNATGFSSTSWSNDGSGGFGNSFNGLYNQSNSNDGFVLYLSSGYYTGTVSVYGYND